VVVNRALALEERFMQPKQTGSQLGKAVARRVHDCQDTSV